MLTRLDKSAHTVPADLYAGVMIFIVALPLYLGIAVSCGAPIFAGIISGIVGGIVVARLGGTTVGVSGPSAGLATIMIAAIPLLGYEHFLVVVVLSGLFQIVFGYLKLGTLGYYFPAAGIKGMIASIGIVLILKQLPYFLGMGHHHFTHFSFFNHDGSTSFSVLLNINDLFTPGSLLIGSVSLLLLWLLNKPLLKKTWLGQIPVFFTVLLVAVSINSILPTYFPAFRLEEHHFVNLPALFSNGHWEHPFIFPDFTHLGNPYIFRTALALALISSLEALLVVEAAQKLDPQARPVDLNRELKGQGVANFLAGMIGGIPITQVIVLNAANINSGGQTRRASIFHALILLIFGFFLPGLLNQIPLAALAAILIAIGYQLSSVTVFRNIFRQGPAQFVPFVVTILVILLSDILTGVIVGIITGFFFQVREQQKFAFQKRIDEGSGTYLFTFGEFISFISKGNLQQNLENIPENTLVCIDGSNTKRIDRDVLAVLRDFREHTAKRKNIQLEIKGLELPA